jgi:uncharacterized protein (DUF1778 family)
MIMTLTKAQKKATAKWNKANLDRIQLVVKKGEKDNIKRAAQMNGQSLNSYIVSAIHEKMAKK